MKPILTFFSFISIAAAAFGQPGAIILESAQVSSASEQTYKRLAEIERKLVAKKTAEALEDLQRMLETAGDDLVSPTGVMQARPARRVAQQLLNRLPADALANYRTKVDLAARKLVDEGVKTRNPRFFTQAVDKYFPSRPTEEALFWLGEHAFERGEFRAAEEHWRRILRNGRSMEAGFPDPSADQATIFAKVILAIIFQGETARASADLALFEAGFAAAEGRLAGVNGNYLKTLKTWLNKRSLFSVRDDGEGEWTSFGGSPSRASQVTGRMPYYWPSQPSWRVTLPSDRGATPMVPKVASARSVCLHPVVMNDIAYVADAFRIYGYDLQSGSMKFSFNIRNATGMKLSTSDLPNPNAPVPESDFTLSAGGNQLFARLGEVTLFAGQADNDGPVQAAAPPTSFLVGFSAQQNQAQPLQLKWKLSPPVPLGTPASWEGAPVWHQQRIYATFSRNQGNRIVTALACFEDLPNDPVWVTDLVECSPALLEKQNRHELLTLAGDQLIYCSHTGAVVAVDIHSGKPNWSVRYAKSKAKASVARDIAPVVSDGGRLFIAPNDSENLLALDALTGQQLWQVEGVQIDHILGISQGKLIAAINAPVRGIRAWNVQTGSDREPEGWRVHDDPQLASYGRGLVSERMILWPTSSGIFFLHPADGTMLRAPLRMPHGNLGFAKGVLLVGRASEMWGYAAERLDIPARRFAAERQPGNKEAQRQLAISLADNGNWLEASEAIDKAEPLVDAARIRAEWHADRFELARSNSRFADAESLKPPADLPFDWAARLQFRNTGKQRVSYLSLMGPSGFPLRPGDQDRELSQHEPRAAGAPEEPTLHSLPPGASVKSVTQFENLRTVPLLPFQGDGLPGLVKSTLLNARLLVTDGDAILAYKPQTSELLWKLNLPKGLQVFQAGEVGESVVAAGPRGAIRFRLADGKLEWANLWADVDPVTPGKVPQLRSTNSDPQPTFHRFVLTESRLVALADTHLLIAFDLAHGSFAWVLNSLGKAKLTLWSYSSAPGFSPEFFADDDFVLIQTTHAERWTVRTSDGRLLERAASSPAAWTAPPLQLLNGLYAVPSGGESIQALECNYLRAKFAKLHWESDLERSSSATGQPPQLIRYQDSLILGVYRNHGYEIERLQTETGDRVWTRTPPLLTGTHFSLKSASHDNRYLYVVAGQEVAAIRLADGIRIWRRGLDSALPKEWRTKPGNESLLVYALEPQSSESIGSRMQKWLELLPSSIWRLPSFPSILYDAWMEQTLPLYWISQKNGQVQHRLELTVGPVVGVHVGSTLAVVATSGRAYWLGR
jgi:hypothetical protein